MNDDEPGGDGRRFASLARGVRVDLVIAVCALLVSSLATAASWWQTRVVQQQLSAQVWPYLELSETIDGDTVQVLLVNNGLGPAILRSLVASVDGKPRGGTIGVLHAILGPHVFKRVRKGERTALSLSTSGPGSVIRAGDSAKLFSLTNRRFAPLILRAYPRTEFRTCYCAIVPGTCWLQDSNSSADPQPVSSCPEVSDDLLHESITDVLDRSF